MKQKNFVFLVLMIGALVIGGYMGQHMGNDALAYTVSLGINNGSPMQFDLIIVTLTLGLTLDISIAQILCIFAAILIFIPLSAKFPS